MSAVSGERVEIGAAARFEALVRQDLRRVPILRHCLILVCSGVKEMADDAGTAARVATGDVALLYAGGRPTIGNVPDPATGLYVAQVLAFGPRALTAFRQHYSALAAEAPPSAPNWQLAPSAPASPDLPWRLCPGDPVLAASVRHAAAGLADDAVSERVALHRCVEVLAAMAERGLFLPADSSRGTIATVEALVAARPHVPWTAGDAARALGVSEPTLRRRLAAEGTSFRIVVAEIRLTHGLMLLHTTRASVLEIALACGYESPSRFATRFRERFGMSPSEMRGG